MSSGDALRYLLDSGYHILPIKAKHTVAIETLPGLHQDPFDRIKVEQAITEPMRLMTHDATVSLYSDTIMKV